MSVEQLSSALSSRSPLFALMRQNKGASLHLTNNNFVKGDF